jgi:hypothetical protein
MDDSTVKMVAEAYDETFSEAVAQGHPKDVAHKEGITAAAMFLASLTGLEDSAARGEVEKLGLNAA